MSNSFNDSKRFLYTSESVTEGHPDKLSDQISDALVDEVMGQDPEGRTALETWVTEGRVGVIGEINTIATVDWEERIRERIREVGYTKPEYGFDDRSVDVYVWLKRQSSDISGGVDVALEVRGTTGSPEATAMMLGAGDQGMMNGFGCTETETFMPLGIDSAHGLTRQMAHVRKSGIVPYLGPDGKAQVTVEYEHGIPKRIDTVVVSTQHDEDVSQSVIEGDVLKHVIVPVIPKNMRDSRTKIYVNPSGRFVKGGPAADAGLTGRKILVDTYGGMARHGGGAFSGKDPTKVDRSGAYAARYVAKNLVAAGVAERLEVQLSYAIGMATPISISVESFGTNHVPDEEIIGIINGQFDLRPSAIIRDLGLRSPIYAQTAAYGHFGRADLDLPWERTDKAECIRTELRSRGWRV